MQRVFTLGLGVVLLAAPASVVGADSASNDTLVLVNDDAITAGDLDRMVMAAHRTSNMRQETSGIVQRLLNKRINDLLIIQDARAAGMDEEPEMVEFEEKQRAKYAIDAYARANVDFSVPPPEDSIRAFFERYYWQIQVRRISVRTREEAQELRARVMAGADMDSLARAVSLDTHAPKGGLYRLLYWADVENRIRDAVRYLEVGEYSDVFPYNDAYFFARVEQRLGVDESAFEPYEKQIRRRVGAKHREEIWDEFVDAQAATMDLREDADVIAGIQADSAVVLKGEFNAADDTPAMWIVGGPTASANELREKTSSAVMSDGTLPFTKNFAAAKREVMTRIVLHHAAQQAGYFEKPEIEARVTADMEQALIEAYLKDTVASRITFKRSEFDEFYEVNKEKFRGPEEVKLDILILDNEKDAKEAARRLADGADFAHIVKEYKPGEDVSLGQARFIAADKLSQPFREQLVNMDIGQCSDAVEMPMGWMVFRLAARRPGSLQPMAAVEMEIRRVIYQEKFNHYLDEHLELLKAQSDIREFPDRIEAYILSGEEKG